MTLSNFRVVQKIKQYFFSKLIFIVVKKKPQEIEYNYLFLATDIKALAINKIIRVLLINAEVQGWLKKYVIIKYMICFKDYRRFYWAELGCFW